MAEARNRAWDELYGELETEEGEKKLFKLAMNRDKGSKDQTQIGHMKNERGQVLMETDMITKRWKTYFETLLNEENPRTVGGWHTELWNDKRSDTS